MLKVEIINNFDEKILREILLMRSKSLPKGYEFDNASDYFKEMMKQEINVNILLKNSGKLVGYFLAIPHNEAVRELKKYDPEIKEDPKRFYVDTISILPGFHRGKGFFRMIEDFFNEIEKRGINNLSAHLRVNNGLSKVVQRVYGYMITQVRRIENWQYYNYEEPTDYIEGTFDRGKRD